VAKPGVLEWGEILFVVLVGICKYKVSRLIALAIIRHAYIQWSFGWREIEALEVVMIEEG